MTNAALCPGVKELVDVKRGAVGPRPSSAIVPKLSALPRQAARVPRWSARGPFVFFRLVRRLDNRARLVDFRLYTSGESFRHGLAGVDRVTHTATAVPNKLSAQPGRQLVAHVPWRGPPRRSLKAGAPGRPFACLAFMACSAVSVADASPQTPSARMSEFTNARAVEPR